MLHLDCWVVSARDFDGVIRRRDVRRRGCRPDPGDGCVKRSHRAKLCAFDDAYSPVRCHVIPDNKENLMELDEWLPLLCDIQPRVVVLEHILFEVIGMDEIVADGIMRDDQRSCCFR